MSLRLKNTLTNKTEIFRPLKEGQVSIYCCGVTVYDLCHLGHARSYISWDALRRYLIWQGYQVTFVQNFTDIDDKIINRALKEGSTMEEVSNKNIEAFHQDMNKLGVLKPDRMPRATHCLDEIKSLIQELETNGLAYSIDGDVYFEVMKHHDYGKLSGRNLNEQLENVEGRVQDIEEARKKTSFDFALWKGAKDGEPSFPSPWGNGRPGWHIECSAMVREELGNSIDIHLGGADLIFPHHENEIAQSESVTGEKLAQYWLHNGMVNVKGQKMSKSLGNFTTIRSLLEEGTSPMTLRFFILQSHYRKPVDFTSEALKAAATGWKGLNSALTLGNIHADSLGWGQKKDIVSQDVSCSKDSINEQWHLVRDRFIDAMDNDLNTSGAIAVLFDIARPLRSIANHLDRGETEFIKKTNEKKEDLYIRWQVLVELAGVLGLRAEKPHPSSIGANSILKEDKILEYIELRKKAKQAGDFPEADKIRNELKTLGIELIDKPGGITQWMRA